MVQVVRRIFPLNATHSEAPLSVLVSAEVSPLLLATPSRLEARRSDFDSRLLARSAARDWRRRARLANSICQRKNIF